MKKKRMKIAAAVISASLLLQGVGFGGLQAEAAELSSVFDLRERGVVTSVKNQEPFSSCWAFGGIAAAESSILTELGLSTEQYKKKYGKEFNLSEKHLSWWAYHAVPGDEEQEGTQVGEGVHIYGEDEKDPYTRNLAHEIGGMPYIADEIFSVGIGPNLEGYAPYVGYNKAGKAVYRADADWTLADRTREHFSFELIDGNRLPSPIVYKKTKYGFLATDRKGDYIYQGYDKSAEEVIKQEVYAGRGVAISYRADISTPAQRGDGTIEQKYMSANWAQYTDDRTDANHVVCIVGWNDDYAVENFKSDRQPPAPGAWLCKNSWGSGLAAKSSHNYANDWGILDENGNHTGYFWLSYYDRSISEPESLRFIKSKGKTTINAYDYMQGGTTLDLTEKRENRMANVFTTQKSQKLKAVGVDTVMENTTVKFEVYKLNEDSSTPVDGKRVAAKTAKFAYAGFHRVNLNRKYQLKKGDRFSVVVTQTVKKGSTKKYSLIAAYGPGEQIAKKWGLPYYSVGVINEGESFYGSRSKKTGKMEWEDWAKVTSQWKKSDGQIRRLEIDNFPIKVYGE